LAVAFIVMATGAGPQEKVMTPPAATAATTAAEVQLAAVPLPTTRVGCEVSTAFASAGTVAWPLGLPNVAGGGAALLRAADGLGDGELGVELATGLAAGDTSATRQVAVAVEAGAQPVRAAPSRSPATSAAVPEVSRTGRL
jgi:hypothetical protein